MLDPLELELQVVVSCLKWAMGTEVRSPVGGLSKTIRRPRK